jgi:hypothetical protein
MRKHVKTLITPLAALAVAGTIGLGTAGSAQAHGDWGEHGGWSGHDPSQDHTWSAQIETDPDAAAALADAGVTLDAVEPATAEPQEDGTTELTFPKDESQEPTPAPSASTGTDDTGPEQYGGLEEVAFDGGITASSDTGAATWEQPTYDISDGTVSFDVDGQQVDLLQAVPASDESPAPDDPGDDPGDDSGDDDSGTDSGYAESGYTTAGDDQGDDQGDDPGDESGHDSNVDLVLTEQGAEGLNAVAGEGTFAAGDVFASVEDGWGC